MKSLRTLLLALVVQTITVEAGLVGLRNAFFGTGPYTMAPLNRRAGGITNPGRCTGIENVKRFQPHQPHECRMLEATGAGSVLHGGWNYCPEDPNANCYIPMACVDENECKDNKCGLFDNPEFTTISCSENFYCGHTAIVDKVSPELDATRWVCNPTQGLAITIAGAMKVNNNMRTFDGRNAEVETATTFVPGKTNSKAPTRSTFNSATASSSESLTTITDGPSVVVSTATMVITSTDISTSGDEKTNLAPIIGGAVGGAAAALALIGLAIFLLMRPGKRNKAPAPIVLPSFEDSPTSTSSEKNTIKTNSPPESGKILGSNWQPTPATIQGTWASNTNNGSYSGTHSEMPTPDMLGRDWTQQTSQQTPEGPHEMSSTSTAAVAWGNESLSHEAHGWVDQKQALQFQGMNSDGGYKRIDPEIEGQQQQQQDLQSGQPILLNMSVVVPGGFPASLTPGMGDGQRAELA